MTPGEAITRLLDAILSALPSAALALLFAVFAVVLTVVFLRAMERRDDQAERRDKTFTEALAKQGDRWRDDMREQNGLWRSEFSNGMARLAGEVHALAEAQTAQANALVAHDREVRLQLADAHTKR